MGRKTKYTIWQDEAAVRAAFDGAETMLDAFRKLGLGDDTYHYKSAKIYLPKYDIVPPVPPKERMSRGAREKNTRPFSEILVENSTYTGTGHLKKRLLDAGLLINRCVLCGLEGEWNGRSIVLQLDHINGKSTDNRIENLRMLCPNCHSQTDTFCKGAVSVLS